MDQAVTRIHGAICTSVTDALQDQMMAEPEQLTNTNSEVQKQIQERQAFEDQVHERIEKLEREVDRLKAKSLEQPPTREEYHDPQNYLAEMFS
ncbi:hypothetical protein CDV36_000375 [Fusarium kuroshium]|uniref:Uncharacterized protein n=2 Tax=Fusarium solani species complex TaxID=232080 RepID=A0A3M2SRH9_9HYPO|nr:hypothetical protein CDV36_000375 [Fusarium kuroshium]RSL53431.1 hypothetical protein CEP51_014899 [Fusarium floridanum]